MQFSAATLVTLLTLASAAVVPPVSVARGEVEIQFSGGELEIAIKGSAKGCYSMTPFPVGGKVLKVWQLPAGSTQAIFYNGPSCTPKNRIGAGYTVGQAVSPAVSQGAGPGSVAFV